MNCEEMEKIKLVGRKEEKGGIARWLLYGTETALKLDVVVVTPLIKIIELYPKP